MPDPTEASQSSTPSSAPAAPATAADGPRIRAIRGAPAKRVKRSAEATNPCGPAAGPGKTDARHPRREDRRAGPPERARIAFRGGRFSVAVLDVSRRGAMIDSDLIPDIGEQIAVQFHGCNPLDCQVRWVRAGRIGLEFREETALFLPGEPEADTAPRPERSGPVAVHRQPRATGTRDRGGPSRPERQRVMWQGTLYWDGGSTPVALRNISSGGAMVAGSGSVRAGTEVVLALKLAGTVPATIKWCRGGQFGLAFERAFDVAKLVDPRKRPASTAPARPGILKPLYLETELEPDSPWAARWEKLRPRDLM